MGGASKPRRLRKLHTYPMAYAPNGRITTQWKGGENGQFNALASITIVVYRFGIFHHWL
jgi:hypothetical protein